MSLKGRFHILEHQHLPINVVPQELENTVTDEGELEYLKMIFQAAESLIASGGNFYMGLTSVTPADNVTLSGAAAAEPTVSGGYARIAIARDNVGWPTTNQNNGVTSIQSKVATFIASGAAFSTAITRLFLTDTLSGASGTLLSISSAFVSGITVADGDTLPVSYESYLY